MMKPRSTTNNLEVRNQPVSYNPQTQRTKKCKKNKHKIVLVGISDARDCSSKLRDKLPDHCEVIDVNPGAGIAAITKVAEKEY